MLHPDMFKDLSDSKKRIKLLVISNAIRSLSHIKLKENAFVRCNYQAEAVLALFIQAACTVFSPKGHTYSWKHMNASMQMDELRHMRGQAHDASRILSITTQAKVQ